MAKSFYAGVATGTSLVDSYLALSLNSSSSNVALGKMLVNEQHKYTLLKYFDNEATITMTTVAAQNLTLTGSLATGATTGTLTSAWNYITCDQLATFTDGEQRTIHLTQNGTGVTWQSGLNASVGTGVTTLGVQAYPLPANVSKVKNGTISVGQLVYTPAPVQSIQEWTKLNALPYSAEIPCYFFIWNNQLNFWPIPSATGDVISINCQINVSDMTYTDYSTGTISLTAGSNQVTGSGTSWTSQYPSGVDLTAANLFLVATPPNGDGLLYQIQSVTDDTHLVLIKPIVRTPKTSSIAYSIGQYPYLHPDFHDILVYWALRIYYSTIVKDTDKFQMYDRLYSEKLTYMESYLSTKQVNVDLSVSPVMQNPNLYPITLTTQ